MASKTLILLEDDIDGGAADETVSFGLDGKAYEIDLSEKNATKLRKALAAYVASGRRGSTEAGKSARRRSGAGSDAKAMREWAAEQGYEVSARGRISAGIQQAYQNR